jgi:hypothetical protein
MTEKHEKEFTEFELSMNFPIVEEASDRQRMKQDSLRFANDIIDGLKMHLGHRTQTYPQRWSNPYSRNSHFWNQRMLTCLSNRLQTG